MLFRVESAVTLIVPDHAVLKVGLLRKLMDQVGLTVEEFAELLR